MKIAYFVSMKEKLETFITNEINLLSKKNFKISIFSTLSKSKYITIDNSNYKINNFNILNFIFGLIILLITKPFKTLELIINSIIEKN